MQSFKEKKKKCRRFQGCWLLTLNINWRSGCSIPPGGTVKAESTDAANGVCLCVIKECLMIWEAAQQKVVFDVQRVALRVETQVLVDLWLLVKRLGMKTQFCTYMQMYACANTFTEKRTSHIPQYHPHTCALPLVTCWNKMTASDISVWPLLDWGQKCGSYKCVHICVCCTWCQD